MVVEATSYRYGTAGRPVGAPKFGSGATTATLIPNANDDASSTWIDLTAYDSMSREDDEERDDGISASTDWPHVQHRTNNNSPQTESVARPSHDQNLHHLLDGINDMVVRESPFSLAATLSGDDGVPIRVWESTTHTMSSTLEKPAPVIRLWDAESPPRPEHPVNGLSRYQKALVRLDGVRRQTRERSATVAKDTDILSTKHEHLIQQNKSLQTNHALHRQAAMIIDVLDDDEVADNRDDHIRSGASSRRGRHSAPSTPSSRLFIDTSAMEAAYETQSRHGGAASAKDFMTAFSYEFKNRLPDQPIDVINIDDIIKEQREMAETTLKSTTPRSSIRVSAPRTPERYNDTGSSHTLTLRNQQATTNPVAVKPATRRNLLTNNAVLLALSRSPPSSPRSQSSSQKKSKRVPTQRSLDLQRDKITAIRNTVKTLQMQKGGSTSPRHEAPSPIKQQLHPTLPNRTRTKGENDDNAKVVEGLVASKTNAAAKREAKADSATPSQAYSPSEMNAGVPNSDSPVDPSPSAHKKQDSPEKGYTKASSTENVDVDEYEMIDRKNKDLPGLSTHESAKLIQDAFASRLAKIQKEEPKTDPGTLFDEKETISDQSVLVSDTIEPSNEIKPSEQLESHSPDEREKPTYPQNSLWIRNLQNSLATKETKTDSNVFGDTESAVDTISETLSQKNTASSYEVATAEDPAIILVSTDIRKDCEILDPAAKVQNTDNTEAKDNGMLDKTPESNEVVNDHVIPSDTKISDETAPDSKLEPLGEHLVMALATSPIEGTLSTDDVCQIGILEQITPSIKSIPEIKVENSQETINAVAEIREDENINAVAEIREDDINAVADIREDETLDAVFESGSCEGSQNVFQQPDETSLTVASITLEDSILPTETESWTHPEEREHNSNKRLKSPSRARRETDERKDNERDVKPSSKKEREGSGSEDNASFATDLSASKVSIVDSETTDSEMEEEPEIYGPCSGLPFAIQLLDVTCAWLEKEETSFCFQPSLLKKVKKRDNKHNPSRPVMTSRIPRSAALSRCFGDSKKQTTESKFMRPKPNLKSDIRGPSSRSSGTRARVFESPKGFSLQNLNVINVPIDQRSVDAMETTEVVVTPTRSNVTKQLEAQQSEDTGPFAPNEAATFHRPTVFDGSIGTTETDDVELTGISELADAALQAKQENDEATSSVEQGSNAQSEKAEKTKHTTLETSAFFESPLSSYKTVDNCHEAEINLEAPVSVMSDEVTLKKGNQTSKCVPANHDVVAELQSEGKDLDQIIETVSVEESQTTHMISFRHVLRNISLSPSQSPNDISANRSDQACLQSADGFLPVAPVLLANECESAPSHACSDDVEVRLVRSMDQVPIGPDIVSEDRTMNTDTIGTCPSESSVEEVDTISRYRSRRECLAKLKKQLPRTSLFEGGATTPKSLSENGISTMNDEQRHAAMELAEKLRRRATTLTRRRKIRDRRKELRVLVTSPPTSPTSTQGFSDNSV